MCIDSGREEGKAQRAGFMAMGPVVPGAGGTGVRWIPIWSVPISSTALVATILGCSVGLHLGLIALFLVCDSVQSPFSALLPPTERPRGVMLMHHKRLPQLEATLRTLASLPGASELRVNVAQSLYCDELASANATEKLLRSLQPRLGFAHLDHRVAFLPRAEPVPGAAAGAVDAKAAASYSIDVRRYGTKKNSFRNIVHGLSAVFGSDIAPQFAIVMEDDVQVPRRACPSAQALSHLPSPAAPSMPPHARTGAGTEDQCRAGAGTSPAASERSAAFLGAAVDKGQGILGHSRRVTAARPSSHRRSPPISWPFSTPLPLSLTPAVRCRHRRRAPLHSAT